VVSMYEDERRELFPQPQDRPEHVNPIRGRKISRPLCATETAVHLLREADLCDLGDLLQELGCSYIVLRRGEERVAIENLEKKWTL